MELASRTQKRLRRWLENQVESGNCPGVGWVNREEGTFRIPWYHINKIESKEIPKHFQIFVEWAKYTGKYKDGETPDYSTYKTQLRCALTKIQDVVELKGVSDPTEPSPHKVYRFSAWTNAVSPDSTFDCDADYNGFGISQPYEFPTVESKVRDGHFNICKAENTLGNQPCGFFGNNDANNSYLHPNPNLQSTSKNVPVFIAGKDVNNYNTSVEENMQHIDSDAIDFLDPAFSELFNTSNFQPPNLLPQTANPQMLMYQQPQNDEHTELHNKAYSADTLRQAMSSADIVPGQSSLGSSSLRDVKSEDLSAEDASVMADFLSVYHGKNVMTSEVLRDSNNFPMALTGDNSIAQATAPVSASQQFSEVDFVPLTQLIPSMPVNDMSVSSSSNQAVDFLHPYEPESSNVQEVLDHQNASPNMITECTPQYTIPSDEPERQMGVYAAQTHIHPMFLTLFYGQPKVKVLESVIGNSGCRLSYGKKVFENSILDEAMYGPKNADELSMPSADDLQLTAKQKKYIATTLDNLSRGVALTFDNDSGDIYAQRLCTCRVFAWDGMIQSFALDRKTSAPQKVFDFQNFQRNFSERGSKVLPYFVLTIGNDVNLTSDDKDPLTKVLLHAYVYHQRAYSLSQACEEDAITESLPSEPLNSGFDSLDKLEHKFRCMTASDVKN